MLLWVLAGQEEEVMNSETIENERRTTQPEMDRLRKLQAVRLACLLAVRR